MTALFAACILFSAAAAATLSAEDWPEIQGKGRLNVWTEEGILDKFPAGGLTAEWRTPIHAGYSGPAVADGRVFVSDYFAPKGAHASERVLCLDEQTGKVLWTYENGKADYGSIGYSYGPRATPTVDGDRVFVLGAAGDLYALDAKTGTLQWKINYQTDLGARQPTWGFAAAPIVYGDRLICLAGAGQCGTVVALDKKTGKELWRALPSDKPAGYSAPILIHAAGVDQVISFHPGAVSSLNPATGQVYWEAPYGTKEMIVATPVRDGNRLFVTTFFDGPMLLEPADDKPGAKILWQGKSHSEVKTDGIHTSISTPVVRDGYIYGMDSYGQFRCLDEKTGARVWMTMDVTKEEARWASAFITRQGERYFINNDRGELIIAELSPKGYKEIDRTPLIKPTTAVGTKRELGAVNWVLPAYANRHIIIRNDEEIIRVSIEKPAASKP